MRFVMPAAWAAWRQTVDVADLETAKFGASHGGGIQGPFGPTTIFSHLAHTLKFPRNSPPVFSYRCSRFLGPFWRGFSHVMFSTRLRLSEIGTVESTKRRTEHRLRRVHPRFFHCWSVPQEKENDTSKSTEDR